VTAHEQLQATLATLAAPVAEPTVERWLQRSQMDLHEGRDAVVVERRVAGQRIWYGIGVDEAAARRLHEEVSAFVGRTYASIDPLVASPTLADAQEAAVLEVTGTAMFRIRTSSDEDGQHTDRQLETLRTVQARRPPSDRTRQRPASLIIRDLDAATAAAQLSRMRQLLAELRTCGTLTNVNLECLEIRTLAAQGAWGEILSRPGIDDLVSLRLPRAAAATLIEAVYRVYVQPDEHRPPAQLLELFRDRVLPRFGRLFRAPDRSLSSSALRAWMLFALSSTPPAESLVTDIVRTADLSSEDRAFLESLSHAREKRQPEKIDAASQVASLLEQGQFTEAWSLALAQSNELWRTRVLVHCAYETANPDWAAEALEILDAADVVELLAMRTVRSQVASLRLLVTNSLDPINSWDSWLHALASGQWPDQLVSLARESAGAWSVAEILGSPRAAEVLLEIATGSDEQTDALRDVRPLLLPDLLAGYGPGRGSSATGFLLHLMQTVCSDKRIGPHDLEAVSMIAEALMEGGVSADEYDTLLLACLLPAWRRVMSPRSVGWLEDTLQLLAHQQCPDPDARSSFTAETAATLGAFANALPEEHRIALHEAYDRLGQPGMLEVAPATPSIDDEAWCGLESRRIFIYTLVEPAGMRAREYIAAREPTATIEVWFEQNAERRMLESAAAADLVVIATRAAKHAATEAIERAVSSRNPVVYPTGKGWSSIVAAVREELPRLASYPMLAKAE
jgi:hypothetical protein